MPQEWFVRRGEIERGPLSSQELKRLVEKGTIVATDMIRTSEQPEWREAGLVRGLFPAERVARPAPPPLPSTTIDRPQPSRIPPKSTSASETVKTGLADLVSTAKQAKDLASAHARKTHVTQMILPKAFWVLGKHLFENDSFRNEFSELFQRITGTNEEIARIATTNGQRPPATDLKGKLQAGAAHVMAQGQATKLSLRVDSLLKQLGKQAFELHGTSAGPSELVEPITSANEEISRLDGQIEQLSSGDKGPLWQRLPLAVLFTVICWPVGMILVWLHPRLTRRTKAAWTAVSLAGLMTVGIFTPRTDERSQLRNAREQQSVHDGASVSRETDTSGTLASKPGVLFDNARNEDVALTEEYLTRQVGHVADFTGTLFVGETVVSHKIRETCTKSLTVQCDGTELISDLGPRQEGVIKGRREIQNKNGFFVARGIYPNLLTGAKTDSSIAEYRLFKAGAKPGDKWSDGKAEMIFVGFRDFEINGKTERRAVVESVDRDPSGEFDCRREYHFQKGVGIVFHRQTLGNSLSHEYGLDVSSEGPKSNPLVSTDPHPLETATDFRDIEIWSTTRIPVFKTVPPDIVKLIPKEQMSLATEMEALCSRAEKQIAAASNPAIAASIEATLRKEHQALVQGYSSAPLPTKPIKGWVGQVLFDKHDKNRFHVVLGRKTQVKEHVDPRKAMQYVSDIHDKAFSLGFSVEGATKELLDDIAQLKNGDWVRCDLPHYSTGSLMYVTFSESKGQTFVVHDGFSASAEFGDQGSPRIFKIRSK